MWPASTSSYFHPDGTPSASVQVCSEAAYTNAWSARQPLQAPVGAYAVTETDPLGNQTVRNYAADGTLYRSEGAVYPVATARDADGRQIELRTWRDEVGQPDTTRWLYDRAGMVTNKVYADGLGPSYTYFADGRLSERAWARGVTTTYGYSDDSCGRIQTTLYSDSTPSMTNRYDLAGRLIAVTDGTGTRTYAYDALGRLAAETNALAVIERRYDALGRDASYDLAIPGYSADTFAVRCDYDASGRLAGVTSILGGVTNVFRYSYLEGSAILSGMTNGCGVGWSRAYESHRDLITAISNHTDAVPFSTFDYANDAAGHRSRRVDDGVLTNMFFYNRRSEVTGTVMGARAYSYGYDGIGNRLAATNDGVGTAYLANLLNQYTNILRASAPPHETSPAYDDDGNMLTCGPWAYSWDAENRLTAVFSNGTLVVSNAYDNMSRRVLKTTAATITHFVWDNWNIVAEITVDRQTVATNLTRYVWGLDLSGTLQGAGGVGGLLAVISPDGAFYPCCDANGNITDYVNAAGTVVAHYEYSPFGEITARSGVLADAFAFRFSTKYHDPETGLVMYQLRPYSPTLGRWLCRDPIEEKGGLNQYSFVNNDSLTGLDPYGLFNIYTHSDEWGHVGITDDMGMHYDYGRYRKTYSGKGGLAAGPNILVRSDIWPPQGNAHSFRVYHFKVCPELDKKIRAVLAEKLAAGQSSWPENVLKKFKTPIPPAPLTPTARYMGSDWSLSDNCITFTFQSVAAAVKKVTNDPNATDREKTEAKILLILAWDVVWKNTPDGITSILESYDGKFDWIEKKKGGGNADGSDDKACCGSGSS